MPLETKEVIVAGIGATVALATAWTLANRSGVRLIGFGPRSQASSRSTRFDARDTKRAVDDFLHFHYGDHSAGVPHAFLPQEGLSFVDRCAGLCERHCSALMDINGELGEPTALDIGCSVGGASFALARCFPHVLGLDCSQAFIDAAIVLKEEGSMQYSSLVEGDIQEVHVAQVPDDVERDRVIFRRGDACALPDNLRPVDAILAANVLSQLKDPMKFLNRLPSLLKPGGCIVLVSSYVWLEAWTPKAKWLGGFMDSQGKPVKTAEKLKSVMESLGLELVHEQDIPFVYQECARKYELRVSHATVWKKKCR